MFSPFSRCGNGVRERLAGIAAATVATGKIGHLNPPIIAAAIHNPKKLRHLNFTYLIPTIIANDPSTHPVMAVLDTAIHA
jgi:hypothetical protein